MPSLGLHLTLRYTLIKCRRIVDPAIDRAGPTDPFCLALDFTSWQDAVADVSRRKERSSLTKVRPLKDSRSAGTGEFHGADVC
jgi:hypothetical protein